MLPEFKRDKVVDLYPQGCFTLIQGSNSYETSGYGGNIHFSYTLQATTDATINLPAPTLHIDNTQIPLNKTTPLNNPNPTLTNRLGCNF
ncbi:MAG: hypothetical protein NWF04_01890 [Candidatus Bathyarchaeota archaeon]|nr:hypothetical protein [Candidatus Bathyarchaeota archaeon]